MSTTGKEQMITSNGTCYPKAIPSKSPISEKSRMIHYTKIFTGSEEETTLR
jgi:hypothetical protein